MTHLTEPAIHVRTGAMLTAAAIAYATVTATPLAALLQVMVWGTVFAVGLYFGYRNALVPSQTLPQVTNALALVAALVSVVTLLATDLVTGLLTFLLTIQAARNFSLSTVRELYFTLALSFVLVLFAAAESKSGWIVVWIAVYALAAIATLSALHAQQRASEAVSVGSTDEVGAGRAAGSALFTVGVLALALPIYLVLPQPTPTQLGGFFARASADYGDRQWEDEAEDRADDERWDQPGDGNGGGPGSRGRSGSGTDRAADPVDGNAQQYRGFDRQMPVEQTGGNRLSNDVVLYVRAPQPFRLRGRVFDTFRDGTWSNRHARTRKLKPESGRTFELADRRGGLAFSHTVEIARPGPELVLYGGQPNRIRFPGPVIAQDVHGTLSAPRGLARGTVYSVQARLARVDGRPLAPQQSLTDHSAYLQIPESVGRRVEQKARAITDGAGPMNAAVALEQHLREEYDYTFDTVISSQGETPVEYFLFESQRGHCEFFASSMAMMLRTLEIPARLVTGYSVSKRNPMTGYYEVRRLDGHAWVEAWIEPHGWVTFEPTPYYPSPTDQQRQATAASGLNDYVAELARDARAVAPDSWRTGLLATLDRWRAALATMVTAATATVAGLSFGQLLIALVALAVLGGLAWLAMRAAGKLRLTMACARLGLTRQAATYRSPRVAIVSLYRSAEHVLGALGFERASSESVAEYLRRVATGDAHLDAALAELGEYFGRARYSNHPIEYADRDAVLAITSQLAAAAREGRLKHAKPGESIG